MSLRMRTRDPTYLSVGFGAFFAIIWIYRNGKLFRGLWVQKWRNKDKLRRTKVHRNVRVLSLKRRRVFVRFYLTTRGAKSRAAALSRLREWYAAHMLVKRAAFFQGIVPAFQIRQRWP